MVLAVQNVGRVRTIVEANGSFAVEQSIGSFADCPIVEGSGKLQMLAPYETPRLLQQNVYGYPSKVAMPKRAQFDFQTVLRGLSQRASGAALAAHSAPGGGQMLETAFGGVTHGTGSVTQVSSTTTAVVLSSGSGFSEGGVIVCPTGAGGALEAREIKTVNGSTVTVHLAFSSMTNGLTAYSGSTFFLNNTDGSTIKSLQAVIEGLLTADRWLLKGGQISTPPTFTLAPGSIPMASWAYQFAQHALANGTETTMNLNGALANQDYSDAGINAVMDSELRIRAHGSSTLAGTLVDATEINIAPNIAVEPHITPGGTNNIKQFVGARVDGPPCTGDFLLPHEDNTWRTGRNSETAYSLYFQVGSSVANGGFLISVPFVTIDDFQREAVGGLSGARARWYARPDTQTTTNSTAQQKSAIRVHMF